MSEETMRLLKYAGLFVGGFAIGFFAANVYADRKIKKLKKELEKEKPTPEPEKVEENSAPAQPETEFKEVAELRNNYRDILMNEGYSYEEATAIEADMAEAEFPEDDVDEDMLEDMRVSRQMHKYREEHKGQIEMIMKDDYDGDFPEEDYCGYELWYFPEEDLLTDEDGDILKPLKEYVGEIFDKTRFRTNDWDFICIRNHPKEEKYLIHKEEGTRKDYFYNIHLAD